METEVVPRMYCQQEYPGWFTDLNQLKEYIRVLSDDKYLKDSLQKTIDKGYYLFDGTLYEFMYNPCYHESVSRTVSIHLTREGAEEAMQIHKDAIKAEFDDMYYNPEHPVDFVVEDMKWDDNIFWSIKETRIEK